MADDRYMLDTNVVSQIIKGRLPKIKQYLTKVPMNHLFISVITEAELRLGLAKKPDAKQLATIVKEFLARVNILPWDSAAACAYAELRIISQQEGKQLATMDMLIGAHALSTGMVLVTKDKAFLPFRPHLTLEAWD